MKLTELEPRWWAGSAVPEGCITGITFLCPKCRQQRIGVAFWPPIMNFDLRPDLLPALRKYVDQNNKYVWDRVISQPLGGDTFDTLTLKPSIAVQNEATAANPHLEFCSCRWHGFIENGEIK